MDGIIAVWALADMDQAQAQHLTVRKQAGPMQQLDELRHGVRPCVAFRRG
jgi:hypothetical protein